jgi:hypothetical protein
MEQPAHSLHRHRVFMFSREPAREGNPFAILPFTNMSTAAAVDYHVSRAGAKVDTILSPRP